MGVAGEDLRPLSRVSMGDVGGEGGRGGCLEAAEGAGEGRAAEVVRVDVGQTVRDRHSHAAVRTACLLLERNET